jgi:hypothetical protein
VKTHDGGQLVTILVDCAATLDFVCKDFVRRFVLHTRKSPTKTLLVRLANGQRVKSSTVCDVTFWRLDRLCIPRNSELRLRLIT